MRAAQKPADFDWSAVQLAYETHELNNLEICQQFGITQYQFRYQREGGGWISRRARVVNRADLINRMLKILERQICKLEAPMTDGIDKSIQMLGASSKTLDKLIELRKDKWEIAPYPLERHSFTHPDAWYDEYRRIYELFERTLK